MEWLNHLLCLSLFVGATLGDQIQCSRSGVFAHPTDCTSFYSCIGDAKIGFKHQLHRCPNGFAVDPTTRQCVDSSLVPWCKMVSPKASDPLCNEQQIHCANCTHLIACSLENGEYVNPETSFCGYNGNYPLYCDDSIKSCTEVLPSGCNVPNFVCTSSGYFPDPYKCDIYQVCYNTSYYESTRCTNKPAYNSQEFRCSTSSTCRVDLTYCQNVGIEEYVPDNRYYIFCSSTGLEMYMCPGNTRFNPAINDCDFTCTTEGLFVDMEDCTKFIRCDNVNMVLTQTSETCPPGLAFNPTSAACEDISNVKCPPAF